MEKTFRVHVYPVYRLAIDIKANSALEAADKFINNNKLTTEHLFYGYNQISEKVNKDWKNNPNKPIFEFSGDTLGIKVEDPETNKDLIDTKNMDELHDLIFKNKIKNTPWYSYKVEFDEDYSCNLAEDPMENCYSDHLHFLCFDRKVRDNDTFYKEDYLVKKDGYSRDLELNSYDTLMERDGSCFPNLEKWFKRNNYVFQNVYKYEHSGATISSTPFGCRWDSGLFGILYVSKDEIKKMFKMESCSEKEIEAKASEYMCSIINEEWDAYIRGEYYTYKIVDHKNEDVESDLYDESDFQKEGFYSEKDAEEEAKKVCEWLTKKLEKEVLGINHEEK